MSCLRSAQVHQKSDRSEAENICKVKAAYFLLSLPL